MNFFFLFQEVFVVVVLDLYFCWVFGYDFGGCLDFVLLVVEGLVFLF